VFRKKNQEKIFLKSISNKNFRKKNSAKIFLPKTTKLVIFKEFLLFVLISFENSCQFLFEILNPKGKVNNPDKSFNLSMKNIRKNEEIASFIKPSSLNSLMSQSSYNFFF